MAESLTLTEFADCLAPLAPFEDAPVLAIAVSGGGDSITLMHLAAQWTRQHNGRIIALTVDHQLRPESAAEAQQVGQWCQALDIEHHILNWEGAKPTTAIQASARQARYNLLEGWCRKHQILHLLTAHHQDDQAETVLLRFLKGSGQAGLAGMQPIVYREHLRLLRPLLDIPKARLLQTCEDLGQPFIHDPSNDNPRFTRVRVRKFLDDMGDETSAAQLLQGQAQNQMMQNLMDDLAQAVLAETATYYPDYLLWDYQACLPWPEPVRLLALRYAIQTWQPQQKFIKQAKLHNLAAKLWTNAKPLKAATLGGLRFQPQRGGMLRICHEEIKTQSLQFENKPLTLN